MYDCIVNNFISQKSKVIAMTIDFIYDSRDNYDFTSQTCANCTTVGHR